MLAERQQKRNRVPPWTLFMRPCTQDRDTDANAIRRGAGQFHVSSLSQDGAHGEETATAGYRDDGDQDWWRDAEERWHGTWHRFFLWACLIIFHWSSCWRWSGSHRRCRSRRWRRSRCGSACWHWSWSHSRHWSGSHRRRWRRRPPELESVRDLAPIGHHDECVALPSSSTFWVCTFSSSVLQKKLPIACI